LRRARRRRGSSKAAIGHAAENDQELAVAAITEVVLEDRGARSESVPGTPERV
jgi:hypothetical protein